MMHVSANTDLGHQKLEERMVLSVSASRTHTSFSLAVLLCAGAD